LRLPAKPAFFTSVFDERRKLGLGTRRHRVRNLEPKEPPLEQPVQKTEIKLEASAPATPAYVAYGFATREAFMEWRLGLLK
jgi:hypothetical protein